MDPVGDHWIQVIGRVSNGGGSAHSPHLQKRSHPQGAKALKESISKATQWSGASFMKLSCLLIGVEEFRYNSWIALSEGTAG